MNKEEIYKGLIQRFGSEVQQIVAIEELSELQKELCKWKRGSGDIHHIAEEIADVTIMIEQLQIIFNCSSEVEVLKEQKLQRTKERYLQNG